MKEKNKLIAIKASKYNKYLSININTRILELNTSREHTFFKLNLTHSNKIILQSSDGYYARICDDDTIKFDTNDISRASLLDISFVNKKDMYLKLNSNYLYVDKDYKLKCNGISRNSNSLFKMQEYKENIRQPFVSIYSDANYEGNAQPLVPGYYNIDQLTIGNDALSSIKVPSGFVVTLFSDADYKGDSITITSNTPYIGDYFNDKVSSIIVKKETPNNVEIFSDADYKGKSQILESGYYDINQLTIGNDTLSSIKVPNGFVAILYEDANFKGNSIVITSNTPYIANYFNDKVSSIIVKKEPSNNVIIYSDSDYKGKSQSLKPGYYDINQLTIGNDSLSSIKIPNGNVVTIFEDANFKGNYVTLTSDTPYVGNYFNDKVSSIVVKSSK